MIGSDLANILGFAGMALILGAYAYQTIRGAQTRPMLQHGLNFAGALLVITSLLVHTNLPSLMLEGIWALIALFGLWKVWRERARP